MLELILLHERDKRKEKVAGLDMFLKTGDRAQLHERRNSYVSNHNEETLDSNGVRGQGQQFA